ncbi:MdtA/MuxA family multidrug efflux RND transporter periplasmic adaptor subunit [Quatrionicoccus australiensis]|uniref:MdtA/MuxA family multidrug efflux RND transporter periplasmic adaptor subunit n=1 Tax=Quatrionicoccus australiensis TaxID=138118 RepID=UPI001CF9C545|nr:MdtA/MuxA family multidrug efflux RND transporter periplasmic adaptor subunit [Quatrionicoccus australiensis]MCB4358820.1 MdtA/MuxA family multidrug efflux RND transporter periplasmic adaptor subunit [Quatrionicoccus australiensis]
MGIKEKLRGGFSRRTKILAVSATLLLAAGAGYLVFAPSTDQKADEATNPGGPAGGRRGDRQGRPGGPARSQPVKATEAKAGELDVVVAALGTATASNTALVKARVDGPIVRINFREGQQVKAGDVLAEIDPRPFQIQLDQIRGQVQKDEALLAAAQVDLERYRGLLGKDSIAKQQVDTQEALVRQYKGSVETDKAQEANARLNLGFTRITAPAAGRLGLRQVDVGNIVRSSDSTGIAVITQTQPINVVFAIPAERIGNIVSRLHKGDNLVVEAWDRDNRTLLGTGKLRSIDNQIDVSTGTVKLKAEFANQDDSLFPNQFVNARLKVETRHDAILLQSAAVQRNPQGTYVYVINKEQQVESRPVRLGPSNGNQVAIEEGLAAGERVVLDGADRLQADSKVEVLSVDGKAQNGETPATGEGKRPRRSEGEGKRGDGEGRRGNGEKRQQSSVAGTTHLASLELGNRISLRIGQAFGASTGKVDLRP